VIPPFSTNIAHKRHFSQKASTYVQKERLLIPFPTVYQIFQIMKSYTVFLTWLACVISCVAADETILGFKLGDKFVAPNSQILTLGVPSNEAVRIYITPMDLASASYNSLRLADLQSQCHVTVRTKDSSQSETVQNFGFPTSSADSVPAYFLIGPFANYAEAMLSLHCSDSFVHGIVLKNTPRRIFTSGSQRDPNFSDAYLTQDEFEASKRLIEDKQSYLKESLESSVPTVYSSLEQKLEQSTFQTRPSRRMMASADTVEASSMTQAPRRQMASVDSAETALAALQAPLVSETIRPRRRMAAANDVSCDQKGFVHPKPTSQFYLP